MLNNKDINGMEVAIGKRKIIKFGDSMAVTLPLMFCKMYGWEAGKEVIVKTDGKRLILELAND